MDKNLLLLYGVMDMLLEDGYSRGDLVVEELHQVIKNMEKGD